jgi:hypothetical protein
VVFAHDPRLAPELCDDIGHAVRRVFLDGGISFVLEDNPGRSNVSGAPTTEVVYAIALAKYTGGWDESDPIHVVIGSAQFQVNLSHDNHVHFGTVAAIDS